MSAADVIRGLLLKLSLMLPNRVLASDVAFEQLRSLLFNVFLDRDRDWRRSIAAQRYVVGESMEEVQRRLSLDTYQLQDHFEDRIVELFGTDFGVMTGISAEDIAQRVDAARQEKAQDGRSISDGHIDEKCEYEEDLEFDHESVSNNDTHNHHRPSSMDVEYVATRKRQAIRIESPCTDEAAITAGMPSTGVISGRAPISPLPAIDAAIRSAAMAELAEMQLPSLEMPSLSSPLRDNLSR